MIKLGLDLDGVFADFNTRFITLIVTVTGRNLFPTGYVPHTWHYPAPFGYTPQEIDRVWATIDADPLWWTTLDPYPHAKQTLAKLGGLIERRDAEAVFLTSRPSPGAHWQSTQWLSTFMVAPPQVCICRNAESKAQLVRALGVDVFLDDNTDNIKAVRRVTDAVTVLYDQPWNRDATIREAFEATGVKTVQGLPQFMDYVGHLLAEQGV